MFQTAKHGCNIACNVACFKAIATRQSYLGRLCTGEKGTHWSTWQHRVASGVLTPVSLSHLPQTDPSHQGASGGGVLGGGTGERKGLFRIDMHTVVYMAHSYVGSAIGCDRQAARFRSASNRIKAINTQTYKQVRKSSSKHARHLTCLQVWKMSSADLCEIARNGVLHSGFPHACKRHWVASEYWRPGPDGNDIHKTNVPNLRLRFRCVR
jgi:hypothetical protein